MWGARHSIVRVASEEATFKDTLYLRNRSRTSQSFTPKSATPSLTVLSGGNKPGGKTVSKSLGKILVVDDEPDLVEILKLNLEEAGFEVVGLTDPTEAVTKLTTIRPDTVFTDISMPKLSGVELLKKVHEFDPDLPVVFVSGYVTKELLIDTIGNGIYGVIEKPFEEKRIIQMALNATKKYPQPFH